MKPAVMTIVAADPGIVPDDRDRELLAARLERYDARLGPRVGDFVRMLDGTVRRFTCWWPEGLQTTYVWRTGQDAGQPASANFHFNAFGRMTFSGSLDDTVPRYLLRRRFETMKGRSWFFHHDEMKAHSAVYCDVTHRVYEQVRKVESHERTD